MTTTSQAFKANDQTEAKVVAVFSPTLDILNTDRDAFWEGSYTCFLLGDVLYALKRDPLAGVITQDTFRQSFFAIHDLFTRPGTFEFYLTVFRAIWGDDVDVTFDVSTPGVLLINIDALSIQLYDLLARRIVDNAYVDDTLVTEAGDTIQAAVSSGIKTQNETDALLNELYPAGLWVVTTLVVS